MYSGFLFDSQNYITCTNSTEVNSATEYTSYAFLAGISRYSRMRTGYHFQIDHKRLATKVIRLEKVRK